MCAETPDYMQLLLSPSPSSGTHQKKKCDTDKDLRRVQGILQGNSNFLQPTKMELTEKKPSQEVKFNRIQALKGFGGWGDPRDRDLCMSFVIRNGTAG